MKRDSIVLIMCLAALLASSQSGFATNQPGSEGQAKEAQAQANRAQAETRDERAEAIKAQAEAEAQAKDAWNETIQAKAQIEAQVEAEYQQAMAEASRNRSEAQAAIARAHAELEKLNEELHESQQQLSKERRAEIEAMRKKLARTHRELRESSRELSQINRELMHIAQSNAEAQIIVTGGDKPMIGAILGRKTGAGVEVLGVSPNGPAERAGLRAGDVIVAVGGRVLAHMDDSGNVRNALNIALHELKASEPVIISVERGAETVDLKVVPEIREPLTWQSVVRLPSVPTAPTAPAAPAAPSAPVVPIAPAVPSDPADNVWFEQIEVQEIDRQKLTGQIARIQAEIAQLGGLSAAQWASGDTEDYEAYFADMSELGDFALAETSVWFGMPLTSGLRLAQVGPDLGEYFNTDRGVLVLKANRENALQLQAGDVVLNLDGVMVNSPADFMRALREFTPGEELLIDIKRKLKSQTLSPVISNEQARLFTPQ